MEINTGMVQVLGVESYRRALEISQVAMVEGSAEFQMELVDWQIILLAFVISSIFFVSSLIWCHVQHHKTKKWMGWHVLLMMFVSVVIFVSIILGLIYWNYRVW